MRLKKIEAYIRTDLPEGEPTRIIFIPSGFNGNFLQVYEDEAYNIGVAYVENPHDKEFIEAIEFAEWR